MREDILTAAADLKVAWDTHNMLREGGEPPTEWYTQRGALLLLRDGLLRMARLTVCLPEMENEFPDPEPITT